MVKKLKVSVVALLALLLCAVIAMAFVPWATNVSAAAAEADVAEVVLDKIEDFRTEENGDGTYTICGNVAPTPQQVGNNVLLDFELYKTYETGSQGLTPKKTAFSAAGMRKILDLPAGDTCGLEQGAGDGVDADETDADFAERVYSALYAKLKAGEAAGKKIRVVIPDTVSEIGEGAFMMYIVMHKYSGVMNKASFIGGNMALQMFLYTSWGMDYQDWSVDFDKTFEENMQSFIEYQALEFYGMSFEDLPPEAQEMCEEEARGTIERIMGPSVYLPHICDIRFAKKADGTRALTAVGKNAFGTMRVLQPLTVPAHINMTDDSDDVSVFSGIYCEELIFEEGVIAIPASYVVENNEYTSSAGLLKKLTIPQSVRSVGMRAFIKCSNLTDVTLLSENATYAGTAFKDVVEGGKVTVRVVSIEQWFSNEFQLDSNPFNSASSPFAKNTGKMFALKSDATNPDDYKDNADFIVEDGKVWERVKTVTITEDLLPADENGGKYIPACILRGCDLNSVDIACDITEVGAFAFYGCASLSEVHFKNVTTIADGAFAQTGIKSVEFPASLETLSISTGSFNITGAFASCQNLRSVTFAPKGKLAQIGSQAFFNCPNLGMGEDGKAIPVVIPSTVTTVGYMAFGCLDLYDKTKTNYITEVRFEDDGNTNRELALQSAFYGCRNLEKVTLPDCKVTIARSFNYCEKLMSLYLPAGATDLGTFYNCGEKAGGFTLYVNGDVEKVGLSTGTFSTGSNKDRTAPVTIVASNVAVRNAFKTALKASDPNTEQDNYTLTYTHNVTVKYMYEDTASGAQIEVSAPSVYVYGDKDAEVAFPAVSNAWYRDTALSQPITVEQIAAYIRDKSTAIFAEDTDTITLYTEKPKKLTFRGASNLVYNGKSYAIGTALNALLHKDSPQIGADMQVDLESYTDASGNAAPLPNAVSAAGEYSFAVTYQLLGEEVTSYFDIVIGRQKVDISALDWRITNVQGAFVDKIALQSARLYIYDKGDGSEYASLTRLDTSSGQFAGYTLVDTIDTLSSIARYRGTALTVGFGVNANPDMYDIVYENNVFTKCGVYNTEAVLTPKNNYELAVGDTSDFAARGIVVTANGDGTYTVTKRWYIVQISNWLVTDIDATESNYDLYEFDGDTVFGAAPVFSVPYAIFGDVTNNVYFGTNDDRMTFRLIYNYNIEIGEFDRKTYGNYINASMPAGRYELVVSMETVTYNGEVIPAFRRSFVFTVAPKQLPEAAFAAFESAVNGKTFAFDHDGNMHVLDDAGNAALAAMRAAVAADMPVRTGEWAKPEYDAYYGDLFITYNLDRMQSIEYFTFEDLNDQTFTPVSEDKYIVYYLLRCNNYASIVNDSADYDAARRQYVFYVSIVREIEIPTANRAVYTGTGIKADIASSKFYTVNEYEGFTAAGTHSITLTLVNEEYCRWKGKQLGETTVQVSFEILKGSNEFIEAPDVVRWIEGKYSEEENKFIGAAKFGEISYIITDANDNVIYDLSQGINKLAKAKAGTYILKATVAGNDNYNGLTEAFTIRILDKTGGMPWWGTLLIVLGVLLVAAAVIFVLWKKGVFQILTGKIVIAIRTRATIDATIAAVRANKKAEEAKISIAKAQAKERAEARKAAALEERNKPAEERAAALEEKAAAAVLRAEKLRARAEAMQARAERMKAQAHPVEEAAATTEG